MTSGQPRLRCREAPPDRSVTSFRGALLREPGIQAALPQGSWIPGSACGRPGMMGWTAPDGIIGAKLVMLIRSSKGDRPWRRLA